MKALFRVSDGVFGRGGFRTSDEAIVWADYRLGDCNLIVETVVAGATVSKVIACKRDGEWTVAA